MAFHLFSGAFAPGSHIPAVHTCDGADVSPPLEWSDPPAGTLGFALLVVDPDAPRGTWYHWGVFDIPVWIRDLPEALPSMPVLEPTDESAVAEPLVGLRQARNDFHRPGWNGPCPPHHHHLKHHYRFRLLALDTDTLELPRRAGCRDLERAAESRLVDEAVLTGIYAR